MGGPVGSSFSIVFAWCLNNLLPLPHILFCSLVMHSSSSSASFDIVFNLVSFCLIIILAGKKPKYLILLVCISVGPLNPVFPETLGISQRYNQYLLCNFLSKGQMVAHGLA